MLFTNNVVPTAQTRNPKHAYENSEETDNTYDMPEGLHVQGTRKKHKTNKHL